MTMTLQEAIWENVPFEGVVTQTTGLDLSGYSHPLRNGITQTGNLDLRGYDHPLPNSITKTRDLWIKGYNHPLPNSITTTGDIRLNGYNHPLPSSITQTGYLILSGYDHPLPSSITKTIKIYTEGYDHPLPIGITETGNIDLATSELIEDYPFFGIEECTIMADVMEFEDHFELHLSPRKLEETTNWHGGITLQTTVCEDSIEKVYTKLEMLFELGLFHPSQFEPMGTIFDENGDIVGEVNWSKFGKFWDADIEPEVK